LGCIEIPFGWADSPSPRRMEGPKWSAGFRTRTASPVHHARLSFVREGEKEAIALRQEAQSEQTGGKDHFPARAHRYTSRCGDREMRSTTLGGWWSHDSFLSHRPTEVRSSQQCTDHQIRVYSRAHLPPKFPVLFLFFFSSYLPWLSAGRSRTPCTMAESLHCTSWC